MSLSDAGGSQDAEQIFAAVLQQIEAAHETTLIRHNDVPPPAAASVCRSVLEHSIIGEKGARISYNSVTGALRIETMPDWVHGLTGAWLTREMGFMLKENFLTEAEFESVLMAGNAKSTFSRFAAPYEHSQKMADFYILPWANHLPSIVVEGAWSEDMDKFLNDDRLIWLVGGRPDINKLILCRFKKEGGRKVSGQAELWGLDTKGNQVMLQQEVIWPIPDSASAASAQYIPLTRADVLGQSLPQDRPPNDVYRLSIDSLRSVSQRCMNRAGYSPA